MNHIFVIPELPKFMFAKENCVDYVDSKEYILSVPFKKNFSRMTNDELRDWYKSHAYKCYNEK